jgi:hypothetical protein
MITEGGASENCSRACAPPSSATSSSWTNALAEGLLFDSSDERLGGAQRNVRLEQRNANFAKRLVDVVFTQTATPAQAREYRA